MLKGVMKGDGDSNPWQMEGKFGKVHLEWICGGSKEWKIPEPQLELFGVFIPFYNTLRAFTTPLLNLPHIT